MSCYCPIRNISDRALLNLEAHYVKYKNTGRLKFWVMCKAPVYLFVVFHVDGVKYILDLIMRICSASVKCAVISCRKYEKILLKVYELRMIVITP